MPNVSARANARGVDDFKKYPARTGGNCDNFSAKRYESGQRNQRYGKAHGYQTCHQQFRKEVHIGTVYWK